MIEDALLLRLSRISSLRARERILLAHKLGTEARFRRLSWGEISKILERPVSGGRYPAEALEFDLHRDRKQLEAGEFSLLSFFDEEYPVRLRTIYDPPLLLYLRGNRKILNSGEPVSVVGTRRPTASALQAGRALGEEIASAGLVVVSGLALGIDGAAHAGALQADGGRTIAVLGTGVDRLYPEAHRGLAGEILAAGGLLISEYPPGTEVSRYRFPQRNRVIAGMSALTWVVQAPRGSGALITADFALEGGRDAVVHAAGNGPEPESAGTRGMAEDGAPVLEDWKQFLARGDWPPQPVVDGHPEVVLNGWSRGVRVRQPKRRIRRNNEEMMQGQQLLALFNGDDEDIEL